MRFPELEGVLLGDTKVLHEEAARKDRLQFVEHVTEDQTQLGEIASVVILLVVDRLLALLEQLDRLLALLVQIVQIDTKVFVVVQNVQFVFVVVVDEQQMLVGVRQDV